MAEKWQKILSDTITNVDMLSKFIKIDKRRIKGLPGNILLA